MSDEDVSKLRAVMDDLEPMIKSRLQRERMGYVLVLVPRPATDEPEIKEVGFVSNVPASVLADVFVAWLRDNRVRGES